MEQGMRRLAVSVGLAAVMVTALPGCSPQVTGPSLVLRLAVPDQQHADTGPPIERFAAEVDRLSGGTIRIEPVWGVPAEGGDWDQVLARSVADGTYELGYVPGRAFDVLGVNSLRALNTPFLITSESALATVLDSELQKDLMAGLPDAGLVGLDVHPGGLRHPFGWGEPLLGPDDYNGSVVWSPTSATVAAYLEELGAIVTDAEAGTGGQRGAEAQYTRPKARAATGNVTFFPKTNVLVAGTTLRERLRHDQWDVLVEAAATTREWLFAEQPSDFEAAVAFCEESGGRIYAASEEDLAALEEAAAPVKASLRKDPGTRRIMDAIRDLVSGASPADPLTACPGGDDDPTELDGRYRTRVRASDLRAAGVTDPGVIHENSGYMTWILDGGRWTCRAKPKRRPFENPVARGGYTWEQGRLTIHWSDGSGSTTMLVKIHRDGSLSFSDIQDSQPENQALSDGFFLRPWRRVGDLAS